MSSLKSLRDPLGNRILFPLQSISFWEKNYVDIRRVVTSPSFLIREKNRRLYFFRLVSIDTNLLVEAQFVEKKFVIESCIENPSAEYISDLLKKGALLSF